MFTKDNIKISISRFDKPVLDYQIMNSNYYSIYLDSLKIYDLDIVKCNKLYYNGRVRKKKLSKMGCIILMYYYRRDEAHFRWVINKEGE